VRVAVEVNLRACEILVDPIDANLGGGEESGEKDDWGESGTAEGGM
jgi:hypothetical protein